MRAATCCLRSRTYTRSNGYPSLSIPCYLLPTSQPLFFIIITFFHNSWYFLRGDLLNSIIISFCSLNFLPILLGFLFASFINVAQVILKVLPSIHKFLNSYLLLFLLCHSMYPFLSIFLAPVSSLFFSSSSHYRWKFPAHKFSTFFFLPKSEITSDISIIYLDHSSHFCLLGLLIWAHQVAGSIFFNTFFFLFI